jgi:Domain of unknown function (DUF4156)
MMKKLSLIMLIAAGLNSSCTWVKPTEQAKSIAVANPVNVKGCTLTREVTVSVTSKLWFFQRNADKVATELATLARNEAVNFSGDTVVPISNIEEGHQTFNVYRCAKNKK